MIGSRISKIIVGCSTAVIVMALAGALVIENAYLTPNPVPGRPTAGYFEILNAGPDDRLVGVESRDVERVELHQSVREGNIVRMRALDSIEIARGARVSFSPGSYHMMVYGVHPESSSINITLIFENAGPYEVEFELRPLGQRHTRDR